MKLQHKFAFYNAFTKMAIAALLTSFILIFLTKISVSHLQHRILDKRDRFLKGLSQEEINDLLSEQKNFTDYNILKEEYIILNEANRKSNKQLKQHFSRNYREIEGDVEEYMILTDYFTFNKKFYKLEIGETMSALQQLEKTILFSTVLIMLIAIISTFITDLAFTRYLLAPFYLIIDQKLNRVNDPIHFNHKHVKTSTEDFQLLDTSISTLMKKISDLFLMERQFISNVSHELLTPISILRNRLENMLNDESISIESQAKIVSSIKTLNRLKAIINSLLLISRVENRQFNKTDRINIPELIGEIIEELEDRLEPNHLTLENRLKHSFTFKGNKALIHTLCINIINNAIKYNRPGGRILIYDLRNEKEYRLIIEDTGIGMSAEETKRIFNRFEKLHHADSNSFGLGLAIVKSITAFHQIDINIESEKNTGTKVLLTFRENE